MTTIRRLWGVVNHSAYQAEQFFKSISDGYFEGKLKTDIVMPEMVKRSEWDKSAQILIVVAASTLDLIESKGMDLSKKTIVLIENVVIATQYTGIKLLDCDQIKSYQFIFKPLNSELVLTIRSDKSEPIKLDRSSKVDVIPNLLNAQPPSVLHPVMTFAYKISDADKRLEYLVDIYRVIRTQGGNITMLPWYNPANKHMIALSEWMDSEVGIRAMKALADALNKVKSSDGSDEYYKLAEDYNVAKFDINYAVEFIKKTRLAYPEIDSKLMHMTSEVKEKKGAA